MTTLPVISGKALLNLLAKQGFRLVRQKGSHVRLRAADGRVTTVPVHGNQDLPKGLLRKILFSDLKLTEMEIEKLLQS